MNIFFIGRSPFFIKLSGAVLESPHWEIEILGKKFGWEVYGKSEIGEIFI